MQTPLIEVKNLTVQYDAQVILDDISFSVKPGEILTIVGPSGCGKSTLLRHMIGLEAPLTGDVIINQENITTAADKAKLNILKNIGVMYQSGALFGSMTLLENVKVPLEAWTTLPKTALNAIAHNKLQLVGLGEYGDYLPAQISGGMAKRAAIARAMALDPPLLFLDEPSAGLDPITIAQLDKLLIKLSQTLGITFVIVAHELISIFRIASRVIVLKKGKLIATGTPQTLQHSQQPFVEKFFREGTISTSQPPPSRE